MIKTLPKKSWNTLSLQFLSILFFSASFFGIASAAHASGEVYTQSLGDGVAEYLPDWNGTWGGYYYVFDFTPATTIHVTQMELYYNGYVSNACTTAGTSNTDTIFAIAGSGAHNLSTVYRSGTGAGRAADGGCIYNTDSFWTNADGNHDYDIYTAGTTYRFAIAAFGGKDAGAGNPDNSLKDAGMRWVGSTVPVSGLVAYNDNQVYNGNTSNSRIPLTSILAPAMVLFDHSCLGSCSGTGTTTPITDHSTRILTLNPLQNEATSSTPTIYGSFYNENTTYNQLLLNLSWVEPSTNADLLLSGLAHRQFIFDIGTSTSNQSFSTTTTDLLTGRWLMSAQFSNGLSGSDYFTASSTTFVVGTTTTFYSDYVSYSTTTSTTTIGQPISDCSAASSILEKVLCSLGDRIRDVLQFLFIPDSSVVGKYQVLKDDILSRVPFGYFPLVKNALLSASASSTPVYSYIMPVARQPMFGSLRTGLAAILYLWWIIHMFHRFKSIQLS